MRCWALAPLVWIARGVTRLPQRHLLQLARVLSILLWPWLAGRRRIAALNLALCFPELSDDERRHLLRANQRATIMGALELLRGWYAPSSALAGLCDIEGLPRLRAALAEGRGVLLFTGHFAHAELVARFLFEALGRPVYGVVRRNNSACLEATLEEARSRIGVSLEKKDVRGLLRALQAGEMVLYSADQDFNYQHAFVPFFGISAATLTTTPELVRRGKAEALPVWLSRADDGRYRLRIEASWPGWLEAAPERAAAIYMRELEQVVREHPEQYLWVHKRFKTRPPGSPPIY